MPRLDFIKSELNLFTGMVAMLLDISFRYTLNSGKEPAIRRPMERSNDSGCHRQPGNGDP